MKGYKTNIETETLENDNYRKVLYTGKMQLVVMSLKEGEDIPSEVHPDIDQFIRVEKGSCKAILDGEEVMVGEDEVIIIPAGTQHQIVNTSEMLKLYTIYTPAEHADGTVHATKEEADAAEHEH